MQSNKRLVMAVNSSDHLSTSPTFTTNLVGGYNKAEVDSLLEKLKGEQEAMNHRIQELTRENTKKTTELINLIQANATVSSILKEKMTKINVLEKSSPTKQTEKLTDTIQTTQAKEALSIEKESINYLKNELKQRLHEFEDFRTRNIEAWRHSMALLNEEINESTRKHERNVGLVQQKKFGG